MMVSADDKENETDSHVFIAKSFPCLSYAWCEPSSRVRGLLFLSCWDVLQSTSPLTACAEMLLLGQKG